LVFRIVTAYVILHFMYITFGLVLLLCYNCRIIDVFTRPYSWCLTKDCDNFYLCRYTCSKEVQRSILESILLDDTFPKRLHCAWRWSNDPRAHRPTVYQSYVWTYTSTTLTVPSELWLQKFIAALCWKIVAFKVADNQVGEQRSHSWIHTPWLRSVVSAEKCQFLILFWWCVFQKMHKRYQNSQHVLGGTTAAKMGTGPWLFLPHSFHPFSNPNSFWWFCQINHMLFE